VCRGRATYGDADKFERGADAGSQVLRLLTQQPDDCEPTTPQPSSATLSGSPTEHSSIEAQQIGFGLAPHEDARHAITDTGRQVAAERSL